MRKMWGKGFEPLNSLRDWILSPAHLTRLCYPHMYILISKYEKCLLIYKS